MDKFSITRDSMEDFLESAEFPIISEQLTACHIRMNNQFSNIGRHIWNTPEAFDEKTAKVEAKKNALDRTWNTLGVISCLKDYDNWDSVRKQLRELNEV